MAEYHFALLYNFVYALTLITVVKLPYGGKKNCLNEPCAVCLYF